jgi:hypothetical protein
MNFGRIHQNSSSSFLSPSFLLQLDQGTSQPAIHSPSLIFLLSCSTWTQSMGEARGNLAKIALHPSLSLQPSSTPNQHQATAQMSPRAPPASACSAPALHPLPRHPRPPRDHPCRPRLRGQASPCCRATSRPQPPSTRPNRLLPPTPPIGHALARALPSPVHALDAESGIAVPKRAHTHSSRRTRHPARHRSPSNVPPSPSMLTHLHLLAVSRKRRTITESVHLAVGTARTRAW